jgi:glycosyltransferase involved in cell wall biosynthesis
MTTTNPFGISVLIRTFNSQKTLGQVLDKLKLGEGDEYVAVDSGSTDSTLAIATARGARIVPATGPFNYSKSCNLGFQAALNPWVLVISSHSIPLVPDLLAVFRATARELPPRVVVAYGSNTIDGSVFPGGEVIRHFTKENYESVFRYCGNANTLYRRSIWEEIPFDETVRTSEDKLWLLEVLKRDYAFCLVPAARTLNKSQYSLRYMFLKGHSDFRSIPHQPQTLWQLTLGLGSLTKRFLRGGMPFGNWIRFSSHTLGQFFGSYEKYDNTPGK